FMSLIVSHFFPPVRSHPRSTLFPYTTLFRSLGEGHRHALDHHVGDQRLAVFLMRLPFDADGRAVLAQDLGFHDGLAARTARPSRSEEHTSELQSRENLVCRLLLEKKNIYINK